MTENKNEHPLLERIEQEAHAADIASISYRDYLLLKDHFSDDAALNAWTTGLADRLGQPFFMTWPAPWSTQSLRLLPESRRADYTWFAVHYRAIKELLKEPAQSPFDWKDIENRLQQFEIPYLQNTELQQLSRPWSREGDVTRRIRQLVNKHDRPLFIEVSRPPATSWRFSHPPVARLHESGDWLVETVSRVTIEALMKISPPSLISFQGWDTFAESCGGDIQAYEYLQQLTQQTAFCFTAVVQTPVATRTIHPTNKAEQPDGWRDPRSEQIREVLKRGERRLAEDLVLVRQNHPEFAFRSEYYRITQLTIS